jgi:hypothetical protein
MKMTAFSAKIELHGSVTPGRRLNLDAVLGSMIMRSCEDEGIDFEESVRRANNDIPLVVSHGVFAGSSMMIPRSQRKSYQITGSLERHLLAIPDIEQKMEKNQKTRANARDFDDIDKAYVGIMSSFTEYEAEFVVFTGDGDIDAVQKLLERLKITGFGTKRRAKVKAISVREVPRDGIPGIMTGSGIVLRPVSCDSDIIPQQFIVVEERVRPPYWEGEQIKCFVPPHDMWDFSKIEQMIGA